MYVYIPSSDSIEGNLNNARENPEDDFQFASDLGKLMQLIEKYPEIANDEILGTIESTHHLHPAIAAVEALREWKIGNGEYEHAHAAEHLLRESVDQARKAGHEEVFEKTLIQLVELQVQLKHDYTDELRIAVEYLFDSHHYTTGEDPLGGQFHRLADLVIEHANPDKPIHRELLFRLFVTCVIRGNWYSTKDSVEHSKRISNIHSAIKSLKKAVEIAETTNILADGLKRRYTHEQRRYWQTQAENSALVKSKVIDDALRDPIVGEVLSDDEKAEWQREIQDAVKQSVKRLRQTKPIVTHSYQDLLQEHVEPLESAFKLISLQHDTTTALYWLTNEPDLLPPFPEPERQGASLPDLVQRIFPDLSGHVTHLNRDSDLRQAYADQMMRTRFTLALTIFKLMEDGWISERDFFNLLLFVPGLSDHNLWYITDGINYLFDHEFNAAIHILMPRLETTLYEALNYAGGDVVSQLEGGTGTRSLGSLLNGMNEHVSQDFHKYIELAYADKKGEAADGNLRNRVAHGHLRIGQDQFMYPILVLVDTLRICYRIEPGQFIAQFGYPEKAVFLAGWIR